MLKNFTERNSWEPAEGMVEVYIPRLFDLYPIMSTKTPLSETVEIIEDAQELEQEALFASLCQKRTRPSFAVDGVRWAECALNELPVEIIMADIKNAVTSLSSSCTVVFNTEVDGSENLSFNIQITR